MASETAITVQVCHVDGQRQFLREFDVPVGTTIQQAIELSGLYAELGVGALNDLKVGIYSRLKTLDTVLRERDRVEIYRPLQVDPKMARRKRAIHK